VSIILIRNKPSYVSSVSLQDALCDACGLDYTWRDRVVIAQALPQAGTPMILEVDLAAIKVDATDRPAFERSLAAAAENVIRCSAPKTAYRPRVEVSFRHAEDDSHIDRATD
jgi:hypothetical protein